MNPLISRVEQPAATSPSSVAASSAPSARSSVSLTFDSSTPDLVRRRLIYAFRVFAAIYDHQVVDADPSEARIVCHYGSRPPRAPARTPIWIPARYRIRASIESPPKLSVQDYAGKCFHLFYGIDEKCRAPDWLGEIFEWLTCNQELATTARDPEGRICFPDTIFAQQDISPRQPHAMLLMAWLESALQNPQIPHTLPKAPSPIPDTDHFVVCSHDVDFHHTTRKSALKRIFKNLAIGSSTYRDISYLTWNARQIIPVLFGRRVGDYLQRLQVASQEFKFDLTVFVVSRHGHRRDPDCGLEDLRPYLASNLSPQFEVALHGSYRSVIDDKDLASEARTIAQLLGATPRGNRQHWLRFDSHANLHRALRDAGFLYDSSIGFPDRAGYRAGACFAYPPYDFDNECACPFLEIPLVLMDGSVEADARVSGEDPVALATEVLRASRELGWGGIAIDWHNPIEPVQVPARINQVFWSCLGDRQRHREKWINAAEFVKLSLSRYQNAGLLQGVRLDA